MGPLSGIGDSFFWGTFRVIAAGIGIELAKKWKYSRCSDLLPVIYSNSFSYKNSCWKVWI